MEAYKGGGVRVILEQYLSGTQGLLWTRSIADQDLLWPNVYEIEWWGLKGYIRLETY